MARINRTLLGQYAGFITRGTALIIDIVIVSVSVIVINWMISLPVTYFLNIDIQQCVQTPEAYGFISALTCRFISFSWLFVTFVTAPLYFSVLISLNGQTLGKYVMGVRVVRLDGRRLSFFQSFLRWIGYFLSAIPLGLGFFMSLVDDRRRTLHDRIVGTCVVYSWKARRNEFTVDRVDKWLDGDAHNAKTLPNPSTSVTLSPIYDLIAIDVRSFGEVRTTMNILTEGVAKGEYAIVHSTVLAKDIAGEIGIVGASDLVAGDGDIGLVELNVRIPAPYLERLKQDMPSDSFIILVLLLDQHVDAVIKAVSRRVAAVIRLYDVGETPDALTAKDGLIPAPVKMGDADLASASVVQTDIDSVAGVCSSVFLQPRSGSTAGADCHDRLYPLAAGAQTFAP